MRNGTRETDLQLKFGTPKKELQCAEWCVCVDCNAKGLD